MSRVIVALLACLSLPALAHADVIVNFSLVGVSGPSVLNADFSYRQATGVFSNPTLSIAPQGVFLGAAPFPGFVPNASISGGVSAFPAMGNFTFSGYDGSSVDLSFNWQDASNIFGTASVIYADKSTGSFTLSGTYTGTLAPEPATASLMLVGLLGLALAGSLRGKHRAWL